MWYRFLLVIVIFVTAVGNILVCLAIARERKLQNTTNYFLMSLAVADCLVAILVMPMGMIAEALGHFPLPYYACIIFATMDVLCCTSSIWHMSTMSMDRYFTIRFPFRYGRNKTRRIMLLKIIAVWAISTAISSPVFVLGIVDRQNVLSHGVCAPNNDSFKLYGSVFAFYIPFVIMITTYALTMRSLRSVLVNKKKYNRERSRKQTFRPLAQIINQYAEIAQNIRQPSSALNQTATSLTMTNMNNSIPKKTPYTIITTTSSPTDSRHQFFPSSNSETMLKQDSNYMHYGSIHTASRHSSNDDLMPTNSQHLTISYIKSSGNKRRRYHRHAYQQQQGLAMSPGLARNMNDSDMSTVYEITEFSKSTSSSHDVTLIVGGQRTRRSISTSEQQTTNKPIDRTREESMPNLLPTTATRRASSTINIISPLEEEEASSATTDMDSTTEANESIYMQIASRRTSMPSSASSSSSPSCRLHHRESISLIIPWQYCFPLIQYVLRYYLFVFPYRSRSRALQYPQPGNDSRVKPSLLHQSTSTNSIYTAATKTARSVSTQTKPSVSVDLSTIPAETTSNHSDNSSKQAQFSLTRTLIPSPTSLLTNFFRQTSPINARSSRDSSKSSISFSQRSSAAASSPSPLRPQDSSDPSSRTFRQTESDVDPFLNDEHRPRASSSSSGLVYIHRGRGASSPSHWYEPSEHQSSQNSPRSPYIVTNPSTSSLRRHAPFASTTNTNSSDSSSVFHRFNPRFFANTSHPQQAQSASTRLRDAHIVAANERKALRVLMIIFCVFVTLWTPFFICTFLSAVCEKCRERISSNVWFSITWLGYCSSMANPFIYTIFSDVFRRAFTNIIFCRSSDSLLTRQFSTKLAYPKGTTAQHCMHPPLSPRRSANNEYSGASSPMVLPHRSAASGSNATIYTNRCTSDSFR